jgi:hypothetical protein
MKSLLLCITISAFALTSSLYAADTKPCTDKAACTDKSKACCGEKSACTKGAPSKTVLMTPKAAALAGKS